MGFPFVMRQGERNGLYILHTHGSLMPDMASSGLVVPASEQERSEARSLYKSGTNGLWVFQDGVPRQASRERTLKRGWDENSGHW